VKIFFGCVNLWFLIFINGKEIAMCCFNFGKKVFSFALTFAFGLLIVNILQKDTVENTSKETVNPVKNIVRQEWGYGTASGKATSFDKMPEDSRPPTANLNILSKPRANYTDLARQNNTEGTVSLRVTFLADGRIGSVSVVNSLPDGLTEQAIGAARSIKFQPAQENGIPKTVTKIVQYNFMIY
jgi:TonB family protein